MANLDVLLFSVNKSPPSEVEHFEKFSSAHFETFHSFRLAIPPLKNSFMNTRWKKYRFAKAI